MSDKSPDKTVPEQSGLSSGGGPDSSRGSGCPDSPDWLGSPAIYTLITAQAGLLGPNAGHSPSRWA